MKPKLWEKERNKNIFYIFNIKTGQTLNNKIKKQLNNSIIN